MSIFKILKKNKMLYTVSWRSDVNELDAAMWKTACIALCPGKLLDFYEKYPNDTMFYSGLDGIHPQEPEIISGLFEVEAKRFGKWLKENNLQIEHVKEGIAFVSGKFH